MHSDSKKPTISYPFSMKVIDSQRCHVNPISDLASSSLTSSSSDDEVQTSKEILASGDEAGRINIWEIKDEALRLLKVIDTYGDFPVTTLAIWNRIEKGVIVPRLCVC